MNAGCGCEVQQRKPGVIHIEAEAMVGYGTLLDAVLAYHDYHHFYPLAECIHKMCWEAQKLVSR